MACYCLRIAGGYHNGVVDVNLRRYRERRDGKKRVAAMTVLYIAYVVVLAFHRNYVPILYRVKDGVSEVLVEYHHLSYLMYG